MKLRLTIALVAAAILVVVSISSMQVKDTCQYDVLGVHDPVPALKEWAFREEWRFIVVDMRITGLVNRGCRFNDHSFAVEMSDGFIYGYEWGADIDDINYSGFLSSGQVANVRVPFLIPSGATAESILVEKRRDAPLAELALVSDVENYTDIPFEFQPVAATDWRQEYRELRFSVSEDDDVDKSTRYKIDLPVGIVELSIESDCKRRLLVMMVPRDGGRQIDVVSAGAGPFSAIKVHQVSNNVGTNTVASAGVHDLLVMCDGTWSVKVRRLNLTSAYTLPVKSSGEGDAVLGPVYLPRGTQEGVLTSNGDVRAQLISVNYKTDSPTSWRVWLARNRVTQIRKTGYFLIEVQSDSAWNLTISDSETR